MNIRTKREMYEAYHRGRFGNRLRAWSGVQAWRESEYQGEVVLRSKSSAGGRVAYRLDASEVASTLEAWGVELTSAEIEINESAPDSDILIQGEVERSELYLTLTFSTLRLPMRDALARDSNTVTGLKALLLLRRYLDPSSFDDLWGLLEDFDGAVVEFSCWSSDVGICPRRNTVFWEVRHY